MTPVEATSTCSARQPTRRAVSVVMSRAICSPSSPVHALAQPLLTTMARTVPPDRPRWSIETSTGAACARLVVKTAAAAAGVSDTTSARSSALVALIPALIPAARNPFAAVTPLRVVATVVGVMVSGASGVLRGGHRDAVAPLGVERRVDGHDHRVLAARAELRADDAIGEDLFRHPQVRHDRKAHVDEVAGHVGERAQ